MCSYRVANIVFAILAMSSFAIAKKDLQLFSFNAFVMWGSDSAGPDSCDEVETAFVHEKLEPDLNLILYKSGYEPIEWDFTCTLPTNGRALLQDKESNNKDRDLIGLCDSCIKYYPRTYCNALYNCGYRRVQLRNLAALGDADKMGLEKQLTKACESVLDDLTMNQMLGMTCRDAMSGASCMTAIYV